MARLNCFMFNVHAAGGREMMTAAVEAVQDEINRLKANHPLF